MTGTKVRQRAYVELRAALARPQPCTDASGAGCLVDSGVRTGLEQPRACGFVSRGRGGRDRPAGRRTGRRVGRHPRTGFARLGRHRGAGHGRCLALPLATRRRWLSKWPRGALHWRANGEVPSRLGGWLTASRAVPVPDIHIEANWQPRRRGYGIDSTWPPARGASALRPGPRPGTTWVPARAGRVGRIRWEKWFLASS
jgi:hypothetical protein